ncbi:MAG: hypothetical protein ACI8WB_005888, partial [Phenylobacterium sp.]
MDFVTGSQLGDMLYDLVRFGVTVTAEMVQEKAKDELKSWPTNDHTTEQIVERMNQLGYFEGESKANYKQRLDKDNELIQLLQKAPLKSQNKQPLAESDFFSTLLAVGAMAFLYKATQSRNTPDLSGVEQTHVFNEKAAQHFTSLDIPQYKRLQNLKIAKLSRINLIAGNNNSGKTSLLEVIYLLTKQTDFTGIIEVIRRRAKMAEEHLIPRWLIDQLNGPIDIAGVFDSKSSSVVISNKLESASDLNMAYYLKTVEINASYADIKKTSSTRLFQGQERQTQADEIKILCPAVFSSPFFLNEPHTYIRFYSKTVEHNALPMILEFLRNEVVHTLVDIRLVDIDGLQRFLVEDKEFKQAVDLMHYGEGLQRMFFISLLFASAQNGVL